MNPKAAHRGAVTALGGRSLDVVAYIGGLGLLLADTLRWAAKSLLGRKGWMGLRAVLAQLVRVGVRSTAIVVLVQFLIGVILTLQMAPTLEPFGYVGLVANIVGIAVFRELGPLISAVVLSGFAGASIAAEIGTMKIGEELEALEAHAIPPVRFLVVPRLLATVVAMLGLCVMSDLAACLGGYTCSLLVLGPEAYEGYWNRVGTQLGLFDFLTGLVKAGVFGLVLALLACYEGLRVRDGAAGVGRAATMTVVYTIVALALVDCAFTVVFYMYGL